MQDAYSYAASQRGARKLLTVCRLDFFRLLARAKPEDGLWNAGDWVWRLRNRIGTNQRWMPCLSMSR